VEPHRRETHKETAGGGGGSQLISQLWERRGGEEGRGEGKETRSWERTWRKSENIPIVSFFHAGCLNLENCIIPSSSSSSSS